MTDFDLTETEAEFFAAGSAADDAPDTFADLDVGFERTSFWQRVQRLFRAEPRDCAFVS